MSDIKEIWKQQESQSGKHVSRTRLDAVTGLNCFIGLIGVTGARMFQMELSPTTPIHNNYLRKFRGVEIQALRSNANISIYTIILLEKDLTDIFTMFIEDIIEKLSGNTDSESALVAINQRVGYWRRLFSKATGEILSPEKQRGLYGELVFLRTSLQNKSNKTQVLHSWRGAESSNQDFARNKNAVEIKTSKANSSIVHISNEQQLNFNNWDSLYLGLISVTETTGKNNSIYSIIEEIKSLLEHDMILCNQLETKLKEVGLNPDIIEEYSDTGYSVNRRRYFRIQDGFPLIIKEDLRHDAIHNVKYQIEISNCDSFEISENEVIDNLYHSDYEN
jgi:uncharacterized protein YbaR (Trm112 family)